MKLRFHVFSFGVTCLLASACLMAAEQVPAAKVKQVKRCEHVSGTRIQPKPRDACKSAIQPYRSYSKDQIDSTGEIDIGEALRKIDPIFH